MTDGPPNRPAAVAADPALKQELRNLGTGFRKVYALPDHDSEFAGLLKAIAKKRTGR